MQGVIIDNHLTHLLSGIYYKQQYKKCDMVLFYKKRREGKFLVFEFSTRRMALLIGLAFFCWMAFLDTFLLPVVAFLIIFFFVAELFVFLRHKQAASKTVVKKIGPAGEGYIYEIWLRQRI